MDFIVKDTPDKGKGLFTTRDFEKNQVIFRFDNSKPILKKDIKDFSGPVASCYLQISPNIYLDLDKHFSYFTNHSCDPNCMIKVAAGNAFIISLRKIQKGEEITFDYSTSSTETPDTWEMKCCCSKYFCRKSITGFNSLSKEQQEKYINAGAVPNYVIKSIK